MKKGLIPIVVALFVVVGVSVPAHSQGLVEVINVETQAGIKSGVDQDFEVFDTRWRFRLASVSDNPSDGLTNAASVDFSQLGFELAYLGASGEQALAEELRIEILPGALSPIGPRRWQADPDLINVVLVADRGLIKLNPELFKLEAQLIDRSLIGDIIVELSWVRAVISPGQLPSFRAQEVLLTVKAVTPLDAISGSARLYSLQAVHRKLARVID